MTVGNIGGGLRTYDMTQNKGNTIYCSQSLFKFYILIIGFVLFPVLRNYIGHRSEITCIDAHPYTDTFATSSTDKNVKLWDVKQKNFAMTFKGHTSVIKTVKMSPDGNWVASGDCEGVTKLWVSFFSFSFEHLIHSKILKQTTNVQNKPKDITAGKAIHEFHDKKCINDISFHPEELVLATASDGKVVRFWDLENWEHICRTEKVTTGVQKILFPQTYFDNSEDEEDRTVIAASRLCLRLWKWEPEPVVCENDIEIHVTKLYVIVLGCSFYVCVLFCWTYFCVCFNF